MEDKVSPWLLKAIKKAEQKRKNVIGFRVIIRTDPKKVEEVSSTLRAMGINVIATVSNFITVDLVDPSQLETLAKIPGVEYVSYERRFYPTAYGLDEFFKEMIVASDPILSKLSEGELWDLGYKLKPTAMMPSFFVRALEGLSDMYSIITNPLGIFSKLKPGRFGFPVLSKVDWALVTYTRELHDAPPIGDAVIKNTLVGVIDTGVRYGPGFGSVETIVLTELPSPPIDSVGHGSWVNSCAFGAVSPSPYGRFVPVASAPLTIHAKVFSAFGGASESTVLRAIETLASKGAKVINMSIGAPQTDSIENDPIVGMIHNMVSKYGTIFVISAGNDGPDNWSINTPGVSPDVITVGSVSWKDLELAGYSSRGPQGAYYEKNEDEFEDLRNKYGDKAIKPDVTAVGGTQNEEVVAAASLWYDGYVDFVPDGWSPMTGTSMAAPHVAGLVALLVDRGKIKSADDVKEVISKVNNKDPEHGWGLFKFSYFP